MTEEKNVKNQKLSSDAAENKSADLKLEENAAEKPQVKKTKKVKKKDWEKMLVDELRL